MPIELIAYLNNWKVACDHYKQVGLTGHGSQRSSNNTEHSIHKQTKCRHSLQDVIQVTLILTLEFQPLHPEINITFQQQSCTFLNQTVTRLLDIFNNAESQETTLLVTLLALCSFKLWQLMFFLQAILTMYIFHYSVWNSL